MNNEEDELAESGSGKLLESDNHRHLQTEEVLAASLSSRSCTPQQQPSVHTSAIAVENGRNSVDPRWPYLKKWSVTPPPSPQPSQSDPSPPNPTTSLLGTGDISQQLMVSPGSELGEKVIPASNATVTSSKNQSQVIVQDLENARTGISDPKPQSLESNLSLASETSAPPPSLGVWTIPLKISSFNPGTNNSDHGPSSNPGNSDDSLWPRLSKQVGKKQAAPYCTSVSVRQDDSSPIIKAASQEYPWAAKMKSVCNLNRVAVPVYLEDGTPKVTVPSHVLLQGIENQKEFVVGQFYRCSAPPGGLIHAVVTRIWGKKCRIFTKKLGESSYLFHIPDEATRKFVIQRGLWHVDDCLMFVSAWTPSKTITLPEISTIPVWLSLKNIPNQLYSMEGIKWIASGIGEPMLTYKPWLDPTLIGEAKILVEIKLDRPFAQRVAIEDESGSVSMVDVLYSWLPSKCVQCGHLGHKASRCLGQPRNVARSTKTSSPNDGDIVTGVNSARETESMLIDKEKRDTTIASNVIVPHSVTPAVDATTANATSDSVLVLETAIEPKDQITIVEENSKQDASISLKEIVGQDSPNSISEQSTTPKLKGDTPSISHKPLASSKETPAATSNQVSTNSVPANCGIRRSLSSSNLLTNRFSSLSSDDEDESLISDEELYPKENLSPAGKVFLRDRPVKPSTKAKEMQSHPAARGRGNRKRGRGKRGGRG